MKRILILFFIISVFLSLVLSSCTVPNADEDLAPQIQDDNELYFESIFDVRGENDDIHEEKQNLIVESEDMQENQEEIEKEQEQIIEDEQEVLEANTPDTPKIDIGMTDEEINALAIKRANELQILFINYIQYDKSETVFDLDYSVQLKTVLIDEQGNEFIQGGFHPVIHDEIKTYNDLYSIILKTCTPEYSTKMLKESGLFKNIDGILCYRTSYFTRGPQEYDNFKYVSFNILNSNKIELYFTANSFFISVEEGIEKRIEGTEGEYLIILEYYKDDWYICGVEGVPYINDGLHIHGYFWIPL